MKKKLLLLLICIPVLLSACEMKIYEDHGTDIPVKNDFIEYPKQGMPVCDAAKNYKYYVDSNTFVTTDNKVYVKGNFSDGTNCKLVSGDISINKVMQNYLANDNKTYTVDRDTYTIKEADSYSIADLFLSKGDIVKYYYDYHTNNNSNDNKTQYYYVLKTDNKLYKLKVNYDYNYKAIYTIKEENEVDIFNGEKVLDVYISDYFSSWVKTDKAYYVLTYDNPDCSKYDDIKCEYTFKKDEEISKKYDEILYVEDCGVNPGYCYEYIGKDGKYYRKYNY